MPSSRKLFSDSKKVIPSGVNSPVRYFEPYPFFTKKSKGSHIWDEDGNRYIDFCNGYGALLLGHRRKEIIQAVSKQLTQGTLYCTPTQSELELSKLIIGNFPSIEKVRLVNTGGEATMTAIRLARGFTKKKKIIKFEGCYHGAHDSVLVKAGSGSAHNGISVSDGGLNEVSKNTLVVQYNNAEDLEKTIRKNKDVAGVIVEPILANMGLILPENNFLSDIRKITKENNVPLIFDEVVTGFRVSPGGAQKHFGIKPDITTLGKALGNGFTIAAVGGKKEIMDLLSPGGKVYQASTFAGNPISVSAAISSLKTINKIKNRL
jgi:glutamate-1-semialdehyde 2,1-aminomutase